MSQPQGSMTGLMKRVAAQRAMTHCKRNHEFTPENTRLTKQGTRKCKACARELERLNPARAARNKARNRKQAVIDPDATIIDPVAIIRAANGDRAVYNRMRVLEKDALWNWVMVNHPDDFDAVFQRLFEGASAFRYRANTLERLEAANPTLPDEQEMDLWRTMYDPPHRSVSWAKHLGLEVDESGRGVMLKATRIDMVGGHRYNRPAFH